MSQQSVSCEKCKTANSLNRYFCNNCGAFLHGNIIGEKQIYELDEWKIMRILENLNKVPHFDIIWNDTIDRYTRKVEQLKELFEFKDWDAHKLNSVLTTEMMTFLENCRKPEFQIAFVGTIKTGKSTLINALLGKNYAPMDVTPETAALTKFRYSAKDYVKICFYTDKEWTQLWRSRTSGANAFMKEYMELKGDSIKGKWIGHAQICKELDNSKIRDELTKWSSSKFAEHYFVKEIEVGISSLPSNFPPEVVFVDTPGLSDPVGYRSDITKQYIRRANAVFVCIHAQQIRKEEIETISTVFSFSSDNKNKIFILATHWDAFNFPEKEWKKQMAYLEGRLVGPGFYANVETARENIMKSAAFIFNLCRDYNNLDDEEFEFLCIVGRKMGVFIEKQEQYQQNLEILKKKTNIGSVMNKITDVLAKNYKDFLAEDLTKAYKHILYELRRIGNEKAQQEKGLIEASGESLAFIKEQLAKQEKNQNNIKTYQEQLIAALSTVQKQTQEHLTSILKKLDQYIETNREVKTTK